MTISSPFFFNKAGGYEIEQSLRFNSADSAYLNRTPGSAGNRKTWTWSGWVKRSRLSTADEVFFNSNGGTDSTRFDFFWISNDTFEIDNYNTRIVRTTQVFRDSSAWYHLVVALDTTQATASNRLRVYVNGQEITSFSIDNRSAAISQNADMGINGTTQHNAGGYTSYYYNGYMAEVYLVDGTALTPSSFGETNDDGVWIPKKYTGSYGTNGFYLKFDPTATNGIGHDHSGNGNNFTATGFSTSGTGTDVMDDTPTTNWCTLNPLNTYNNNTSNGNLTFSQTNSNNAVSQGTMGMPAGKWYWEINAANVGNGVYGITRYEYPTQAVFGCSNGYGTGFSPSLNEAYINSSTATTSYCSSPSAPSTGTYMFAFDADARKFWMGVNGTWYTKTGGSAGDPGAGTNELFGTSDITAGVVYRALIGGSAVTTVSGDINFGQRAFAYTPPTGFKALNTANLPAPTIKDGGKYFNTVLYTGNGGTNAITGLGFQPDFVWGKRRNDTGNNWIFDAVRGAGNQLVTNNTNDEVAGSTEFASFDSNGFTVTSTAGSFNASGSTYVGWNWKANGAGSSNNSGTITSTVSANASAGFSIVTWTGNGSASSGVTIGHGLGVTPQMIIVKKRSSGTTDYGWSTWHKDLGGNYGIWLNLTNSRNVSMWGGYTNISSTVFSPPDLLYANENGQTYVTYCFAGVEGYSKFGSYTGNGSSDGPFVFCGFRPAFLLIKQTNGTGDWYLLDSKRATYNPSEPQVIPNSSASETSYTGWGDLLSNGFKIRRTDSAWNGSGSTYIYAAFAENPFGGSGIAPANAR